MGAEWTLEVRRSLPHAQTILSGSKDVKNFITKTNNLSKFCTKSVELLLLFFFSVELLAP